MIYTTCFCFSSRRRHTRWPRDWSSDVCSSDLYIQQDIIFQMRIQMVTQDSASILKRCHPIQRQVVTVRKYLDKWGRVSKSVQRSEERRVGKECQDRSSPDDEKRDRSIRCRGGV